MWNSRSTPSTALVAKPRGQVTLHELDTERTQVTGAGGIAHEGAHAVAALDSARASRLPTKPVPPVTSTTVRRSGGRSL